MSYTIIDIETKLDVNLFNSAVKAGLIEMPEKPQSKKEFASYRHNLEMKYKKQETIDKYLKEFDFFFDKKMSEHKNATKKIMQDYSLNPLFAKIRAVTISVDGKIKQISEDKLTEREMIEATLLQIYESEKLITFNGLEFDLPVLFSRAEIVGAYVKHNMINDLLSPYSKKHEDLARMYKFTKGKSNLNLQLFARGLGVKKAIDFNECSLEELCDYAYDEMKRLDAWVKIKYGKNESKLEELL